MQAKDVYKSLFYSTSVSYEYLMYSCNYQAVKHSSETALVLHSRPITLQRAICISTALLEGVCWYGYYPKSVMKECLVYVVLRCMYISCMQQNLALLGMHYFNKITLS